MTVDRFRDIIRYNEPCFLYRGKSYSICHPTDVFYARRDDWPPDVGPSFKDVDDLLDHWIIEGRPFKEILPELDYD